MSVIFLIAVVNADPLNSLALAEMKILLRDVYSRFTTVPDPTMTAQDMEMSDQLIFAQPRGKKCLLRLIPLEG